MKKHFNILVNLVYSLLSSYFLVIFQAEKIGTALDQVWVFIYLTILFFLMYYYIRKIIIGYTKKLQNKKMIILKVTCIVIAIGIVIIWSPDLKYRSTPTTIKVVATGEKNFLSKNSEVWIMGIKVDGEYIDLSKVNLSNSWEYKNGHIVSYHNQPSELIIMGNPKKEMEISFLNHEWSGKCEVISNANSQVIDLYGNKENISSIKIQADKQVTTLYSRVISYLGLLTILYNLISFILFLMFIKSKSDKKLIISIFFTLVFSVALKFLVPFNINGAFYFTIYAMAIILFYIFVRYAFFTYVYIRLLGSEKKKIIIAIASIFSILFIVMYPIQFKGIPKFQNIKIVATGDKNIAAKGTEVWIDSIKIDGNNIDLSAKQLGNGWENRGRILSYKNQPTKLELGYYAKDNIEIKIIKHPYSGIVKVNVGDKNETVDLYSQDDSSYTFNIDKIGVQIPMFVKALLYLGTFFIIFIVLITLIIFMLSIDIINHSKIDKKSNKKMVLWYALPCLLVWLTYFIAFYPGIMSGDSLDQWSQMESFRFSAGHPVLHTLFMWLLARIWNSPAIISLFQIIMLALVFGYGMYKFEIVNVKRKYLVIITILFALFPPNGMLVITLWTDILYNTALLGLTIIMINIFLTKGECLNSKKYIAILILISVLIPAFRHNGIITIIGLYISLMLLYKNLYKKIFMIFITSLLIFMIVEGTIVSVLKVDKFEGAYCVPLVHQISAIVNQGGNISKEDIKKLDKIMPIELWKKNYDPYYVDFLVFPYYSQNLQQVNLFAQLPQNKKEIVKVWSDVSIRNLNIILQHQIKLDSLIWRIKEPTDSFTLTVEYGIGKNNLGLKNYEYIPGLKNNLIRFISKTQSGIFKILFWRPALYLYFISLFAVLLVLKNKWKILIVVLPVFFNTLGFVLLMPAQCYRYLYSAILIFPIILIMSMLKRI